MLKRLLHLNRATMGKTSNKKSKPETAKTTPAAAPPTEQAISTNQKGQIVLRIHAKPGAKLSTVTDVDEAEVGVAIAAAPRDGAANEELLDYVGKLLGLRKSELDFDKGAKSRSKVLLITSERVTLDQVTQKLRSAAES